MKITMKAARINAGLTQAEASSLIGVNRCTLHNWEHGKSFPDIRNVKKLCEVYAVSYDDVSFLPGDSLKAKN